MSVARAVADAVASAVVRTDSWINALTGLGTVRDKVIHTQVVPGVRLSDITLESLFNDDDLAKKIVTKLPRDATRRGFELELEGATFEESAERNRELMDHLGQLGVVPSLREAWTWARLYGGGAVFIGADDGQEPNQPLNEQAIRSIQFLNVMKRPQLAIKTRNEDVTAADFDKPLLYEVNRTSTNGAAPTGTGVLIHASRLIVFEGALTAATIGQRNDGWQDSVLQVVHNALRETAMSWQSAAHLISDASQGVLKIANLVDLIATGSQEELRTRIQMMDMARSVCRALLVDADRESFERVATSFAGLPEMMDRMMQRAASAAEMPVTLLYGRSPAGLNATGESDIRGWYDTVEDEQTDKLKPRLERMLRLIMSSKDSPMRGKLPERWAIKFRPLWQPTELEHATMLKTKADMHVALVTAQIEMEAEAGIALAKVIPEIDAEHRRKLLQADLAEGLRPGEATTQPPVPGAEDEEEDEEEPRSDADEEDADPAEEDEIDDDEEVADDEEDESDDGEPDENEEADDEPDDLDEGRSDAEREDYNPNQPRDANGRWTSGGGAGAKAKKKKPAGAKAAKSAGTTKAAKTSAGAKGKKAPKKTTSSAAPGVPSGPKGKKLAAAKQPAASEPKKKPTKQQQAKVAAQQKKKKQAAKKESAEDKNVKAPKVPVPLPKPHGLTKLESDVKELEGLAATAHGAYLKHTYSQGLATAKTKLEAARARENQVAKAYGEGGTHEVLGVHVDADAAIGTGRLSLIGAKNDAAMASAIKAAHGTHSDAEALKWYGSAQANIAKAAGPEKADGAMKWSQRWVDTSSDANATQMVEGLSKKGSPEQALYHATQVNIAAKLPELRAQGIVDADGNLTLYRGISAGQAKASKEIGGVGSTQLVETRGVSSWTSDPNVATSFAGSTGVVMASKVHYSRVVAEHSSQKGALWGVEDEYAIVVPEGRISARVHSHPTLNDSLLAEQQVSDKGF